MKRSISIYSMFLLRLHSIGDENPELTLSNGLKWATVISRLPHLNRFYDNRDRLKDEALQSFNDDVVMEKLINPFLDQIEGVIPQENLSILKRLGR